MPGTFEEFLKFPVLVESKMQQFIKALVDGVTKGTVNAGQAVIPGDSKDLDYLLVTQMACAVATPTTGTTIPASGASNITNSTAAKTFALAAPVAGVRKYIIATGNTTLSRIVATAGASVATFDGTNHILTFDALNEYIELIGLSTSRWGVVSNNGVTLSTV